MIARRGRGLLLAVLVTLFAPLVEPPPVSQAQDAASSQIAYLRDGDLWIAGKNGSDQRALTDGSGFHVRQRPALSPDGSLLALDQVGDDRELAIWRLDDGDTWIVPGAQSCISPQFSEDSERLSYVCPNNTAGLVFSDNLDGTDRQVEIAYPDVATEPLAGILDVRRSDGVTVLEQWRDTDEGQGSFPAIVMLDGDLNEIAAFDGVEINGERQHPFAIRLAPEGDRLIGSLCVSGCTYRDVSIYQDFLIDFDGNALGRLTPDWMVRRNGFNISWPGVASLPLLDLAPPGEAATGSPAITPAGTAADASGPAPEPGGTGWIAYVEPFGGAVWIMRPDGSDQTRLTDEPPGLTQYAEAGQVSWSHDGTMLTFNGPTDPSPALDASRGIWIYRNNQAFRLPNTETCAFPAFTADSTRILYTCWGANLDPGNEAGLENDPTMAFVTSSAIDGSDQRAEIRYSDTPPYDSWRDDNGAFLQGEAVDVNPDDGSILIRYSGPLGRSGMGTLLYDADLELVFALPTEQSADGSTTNGVYREFLPDGRVAIFTVCHFGCDSGESTTLTDRDGNEYEYPALTDSLGFFLEFALSPDSERVIGTTPIDGTWIVSDTGTTIVFSEYVRDLAWQPIPVEIGAPVGPPADLEPVAAAEQEGAESGSTSGDPAESDAIPTEPDAATQPTGDGWIAYAAVERDGGAIWLRRPDGSETVRITDDLPFTTYEHPAWSHDGTMLAFSGPTLESGELKPYQGIWLLKDGELSRLPNTETCVQPVFSADNQRIYYQCWSLAWVMDATPAELQNNPLFAVITSSALDGSDQRTELAYTDTFDGGGFYDAAGNRLTLTAFDVNPDDGSIMVMMSGSDDGEGMYYEAVLHFDADLDLIDRYDTIGADWYMTSAGYELPTLTPLSFFLPGGEIGFIEICPEDCGERGEFTVVDADGNELPYTLVADGYAVGVPFSQDFAPDGDRILIRQQESPYGTLMLYADGTVEPFVAGTHPAWQPVPVEIELP